MIFFRNSLLLTQEKREKKPRRTDIQNQKRLLRIMGAASFRKGKKMKIICFYMLDEYIYNIYAALAK